MKSAPIAGPSLLLIMFGMILTIILINVICTDSVFGQIPPIPSPPNVTGRTTVTKPLPLPASQLSSPIAHGVKITSPIKGQDVPTGILTIAGTSKDNVTSDCHVSIIVNGRKPYQNVTATGPSGSKDYSKWSVTLSPKYALIKQGANKITAKFSCNPNPTIASFYSVNVTGVGGRSSSATTSTKQRLSSSPAIRTNNTVMVNSSNFPFTFLALLIKCSDT
ncbi:MAG: hypothetical protein JO297_15545 [Nitrososphaeraceae archaeon]|nr:hypothetical protein [Nitrososphaeraceae archaeon]